MKQIEEERQKSHKINLEMFADNEPLSAMDNETESLFGLMQEIKSVQMANKAAMETGGGISDEERRK